MPGAESGGLSSATATRGLRSGPGGVSTVAGAVAGMGKRVGGRDTGRGRTMREATRPVGGRDTGRGRTTREAARPVGARTCTGLGCAAAWRAIGDRTWAAIGRMMTIGSSGPIASMGRIETKGVLDWSAPGLCRVPAKGRKPKAARRATSVRYPSHLWRWERLCMVHLQCGTLMASRSPDRSLLAPSSPLRVRRVNGDEASLLRVVFLTSGPRRLRGRRREE
jgi:hypothetical protein